jgi:hypothetical protein
MNQVYVGVDLGSSAFQQVAMKTDGSVRVNRDFRTSEANLIKAFTDLKGELHGLAAWRDLRLTSSFIPNLFDGV